VFAKRVYVCEREGWQVYDGNRCGCKPRKPREMRIKNRDTRRHELIWGRRTVTAVCITRERRGRSNTKRYGTICLFLCCSSEVFESTQARQYVGNQAGENRSSMRYGCVINPRITNAACTQSAAEEFERGRVKLRRPCWRAGYALCASRRRNEMPATS